LKGFNYILLVIAVGISSCIEEYVPEYEVSDQKLSVIAELEANKLSVIHLGSTSGSNLPPLELNHDTSIIKIINYEQGSRPEEYRYDDNSQSYKNQTFIPKEGQDYDLFIDVLIEGIPIIHASSQVPFSANLKDIISPQLQLVEDEGKEVARFDIALDIEETPESGDFFHLIPYLNDENKLIIDKITEGELATHILVHKDGMLIDKTKLGVDENLAFSLRTINTFEVSQNDPSYVYFELRAVTREYYDYHVALSRQSATNAGPYTLPVTTYTNIENGQGIFACYSTTLDSTLIIK